MYSKLIVIIFNFLALFLFECKLVASDDIPAMLWNIKGDVLSIKPVSALGHSDQVFHENLKDALHQGYINVLVFAVNKLSLEDFYIKEKTAVKNDTIQNIESFLDSQPHLLLSSVRDPLNYIHKAHCGVQEIVVDNKIDKSVLAAVSKAFQLSCVVILHVSNEGIVDGQVTGNVFMPSFDSSSKDIVGVFTGVKSSWGAEESEHHMFRNLLQADEDSNFLNFNNCTIMYAENATIRFKGVNETLLNMPPKVLEGSECGNTSSLLKLEFSTSSSYLTSVTLHLNFTKRMNAWITTTILSMAGEKALPDMELYSNYLTAASGFSYSCGQLILDGKNATLGLKLRIDRFQVQPFDVKGVFSDSFDCVPFFTIPIWMGVFVSILFIIILNIGIYALFSVNTMDRFDDPKGKTISVGAAAD